MSDSSSFALTCEMLERDSALDPLAARGTVRLALKAAGLDSRNVTPEQMRVVVSELLPGELRARGVENDAAVCAVIKQGLMGVGASAPSETPEAVFARLGGA